MNQSTKKHSSSSRKSSHHSSRGSTRSGSHTSSPDNGANQATWRWDCCNCSRGSGMNNSYIYSTECTDCGHNRCGACDVWRTGL